jgi:7-cyano-7-deazaguanine synthase in queuosine biosynthesis
MSGILIGVAVVGAVAGVGGAISSGIAQSNANKITLNTTQFGQRADSELARALAEKQDRTTRAKILTDSVINIRTAQQQALIQGQITAQQISADAQKRNLVIVSIGGGAIAIASLFVLRK